MTPGTQPVDEVEHTLVTLSLEYASAVDDRDGERLARLFVADGELVVPNYPADLGPVITRTGHAALRQVPDRLSGYDRTFHQLSNHRYAVNGDRASGQVLCVAHHLSTDATQASSGGTVGTVGTDMVWYIRYRDDYRRTEAGWRFLRRELHLQWVEDHPVAAVGPAAPGARGSD